MGRFKGRHVVVVALTLALVASIVTGITFALRPGPPSVPGARSVTGVTSVPFQPVKVSGQTGRGFSATATSLPGASSATVTLAAPAAGATAGTVTHVAGMPTWVQAVAPARGAWSGPSRLAVRIAAQSLAAQLRVPGVVWQVTGLSAGSGEVRAGLDYRQFAQAYGGNYGARLAVVQLPGCALTTPQLAACRKQIPLTTVNTWKSGNVSALVRLPVNGARLTSDVAAAPAVAQPAATVSASSSVVLAATTTAGGDGGPAGTYGATSLKPDGSWSEGGASGSFGYSYPIQIPGASSPLTPQVALGYDSGAVDGQTSATEAQANWAGDGWSTPDSFVEQSFTPCKDSPEGQTPPSSEQTEDMCYDGNVVTLSLDGTTTALIRDDSTGTWRLQDDNGATVKMVTGSGNGTASYNTSYWVITERNGTSYYFGLNRLPGWSSGNAATNSVDTEPVFSASTGDPCYSSSGFSSSVCTMAYRWHLDYVTDLHGDAMSYYYHQDTNFYGENQGARDVSYTRDSYPTEIDYGFRVGGAYGTVPDKVIFGTSSRCVASSCPAISSSNSGTAGSAYPDVPYDLNCNSGSSCSVYGPTFWSTVRLTSISTEQYSVSASAFEGVDSYALKQTEPATGDGTSPTLWLASIIRTGNDTSAGGSSSAISVPAVTFTGTGLQNRVDTTNFPGLYRYRLTSITSELGGVTQVTYGTPAACTASYVQGMTTNTAAASNADSCYPVWWQPSGYSGPVLDWFEKYAVTKVLESDTTGGALTKQTDYQYPGGAAWHFDDNEVVQAKYRTYGQWRGYGTVTTLTGDNVNNPQTESVTTYYRGMTDDNNSTAVTVRDSQGGMHDDTDQLAGQPLETTAYNGSGGPVDHSTIYSYWVSAAAATRSRSGLPALTANMMGQVEAWTRQAVTDGGTTNWRSSETDTSYDTSASSANFGLPTFVYTHTVPATGAYDRCTSNQYAPPNTSENLVGLIASTETDSVACGGFTEGSPSSVPGGMNTLSAPASVTRPDQVVSAAETFYDDTSFSTTFPQTTAPTAADVTMTRKAAGYSSGAFTWQTTARDTYDQYGRVQDAYDGNGNETVHGYTVNSAGLTTAQAVTNPLSQQTAQTLDPTRGLALTATDVNGVVTTSQYDALGRITSEWDDSRTPSAEPSEPSKSWAYTVVNNADSGVTGKTMGDGGGYATTVTIVDSLGRTRQTQADTPQGGRLITDQFYDSHGWAWKTSNRYWDSATAPVLSAQPVSVADGQVPSQDEYTFNGLGQAVQDTFRSYANTVSVSTTVYNGDRSTVIPPHGGIIKATVTDPLGRTSETDEYTAAPAVVTPSNTFTGIWYVTGGTTTATTYGYDSHGNQASITDAAGKNWTSQFDLLGRVTSKTDPDTGSAAMSYDADGNLIQQTDARNQTVSLTYDALNRKTAEYAAPVSGQSSSNEMASWVYDNANNAVSGMKYPVGHVTTETSYSGGAAYITQSLGFSVFGESLGETVTIPSAAGALAGSYTFKHTYTTGANEIGLPYSDIYPAAGGLPAESTIHSYLASALVLPAGLGGSVDGYAQTSSYDAYGDLTQEEIGTGSNLAYITSTYYPDTLKLKEQAVTRSTGTQKNVDDQKYAYDPAGNTTSQTSTQLGSPATSETQCFFYDELDRLTSAWTATDSCATAPSAGNSSMVGDGLGAASAYWTSWTYADTGQTTSQDQHGLGGASDTTTADSYSPSQPHALTQAAVAGGSTSTFGYDAAGNMTSRDTPATGNQTLSWDAAGRLTSVSGSAGTTSYVYDATGNVLLQQDPGSTTLYLPGEQLTATGSAVTGVRIIALPSGGDVVRTGATTSYSFEIPDSRGTNALSLDYTAQTPTWRQFTPYGAPRGQQVSWVDNRGFLNRPADSSTGLTVLGARQYDPDTGQFISPDPVLVPSDPQGLDPYSYAGDDPVSSADANGLCPVDRCGFGIVNNGTVYRHGPVDPGDPSSPYIPSTCSGCGSYPVTSAPPLTPYQVGVELGAQPAAPRPPTISDLAALASWGYRGSDGFTLADMAAWLPGAAGGHQGDGAWDEFCQGIEHAPESACGTNPFTGDTDIYNNNAFSQLWHGLPAWPGLAMMMATVFAPAIGGPELGGLDDLATAALDTGAEDAGGAAMRVFWTGGNEAKDAATKFATENGGETIGMTTAGRTLETVTQGMDWADAKPLWEAASEGFARGASGDAHVFINVDKAWEGSIWAQTELPALVDNQNVSDVVFHLLGG